jgi:hypothetical protein
VKVTALVPTSPTSVMVTPRFWESATVSPRSSDSDDWAASSDGTMMVTVRMVLPALT